MNIQALIDGIVALWWLACVEIAAGTLGVMAYEWHLQRREDEYQRVCAKRLRDFTSHDAAALYGTRYDDGYTQYRAVDDREAA